jgi:glycosyltransferase involved in cell wall biosynthesis
MRILVNHREVGYFYGGTENHIRELSKLLMKNGNEVIFLTEKGEKDPLESIRSNKLCKVKYLFSLKANRSNKFKQISGGVSKKTTNHLTLTRILRIFSNTEWIIKSGLWIAFNHKKFDVVWTSKYTDTLSMKFLNKLIKIPYVESLEGYDYIEAEGAKKVKFVFAISEFIKEKCKEVHNFEPKLITIGVDQHKFQNPDKRKVMKIRKKYGFRNTIILNVARLVKSKDLTSFVKASKKVSEESPNARFIICGDGEEKTRLNSLIKRLNLENKFFILNVFGDDLIEYYNAADIFVHTPILGNHFGIVYLEAMAAGLPIVASNKDASPDTVGNCGLLATPGNVKDISQKMEKLIKNKRLREKLSKNSLKRAKEFFNWKKISDEAEMLFKKAASTS